MAGGELLLSWKSGSAYGSDVLDTANKVDAVFEGLEFNAQNSNSKMFDIVKIIMKALPTGCSVKVKYKMNKQTSWQDALTVNGSAAYSTVGGTDALFNISGEGEIYEMKVELYHSGNTCPEVYNITNFFDFQEEI